MTWSRGKEGACGRAVRREQGQGPSGEGRGRCLAAAGKQRAAEHAAEGLYRTWKPQMSTQMTQKMCELKRPANTLYSSSTLRAFSMLNICGRLAGGEGEQLGQRCTFTETGPSSVQAASPPFHQPAPWCTVHVGRSPTWHQMKVLNTMDEMSSLAVSSAFFQSSSN